MADQNVVDKVRQAAAKPTATRYLRRWGESSAPPAVLATLIAAQHMQPPQFLPLLFPPVLLFSTYLNLHGYKIDAAGTTAAWSGLYLLLARRRKQPLLQKLSVRGVVRGSTLVMCGVNIGACGMVYALGRRAKEAQARDQDTSLE